MTVTRTLGDMIEETLDNLYRMSERPYETTVGSDDLSTVSDTQMTLADPGAVARTTKLEIGSEVLLVTAKSSDATPVFTVSRGYGNTTKTTHATGDVVKINPTWHRYELERWIKRCYQTVLNSKLPNIESQVMNRTTGLQYIEMPADTVDVYSVRHLSSITGRMIDIGYWQYEDQIPTSVIQSGKIVRVSAEIDDADDLIVTYQVPYEWSGTGETAEINQPLGSDDLAPLWAAAYAVARREVSRSELDKIEEWNQEQAIRAGVNLRLLRDMWGEFYRRLDEAKNIHRVPRHRPYRKMAKAR